LAVNDSDRESVGDILEAIEAIDRAQSAQRRLPDDLDVRRVALDVVRHCLLTIGAAVRSLSLELCEDHPAVAWSDMARMVDLIGPAYDRLDAPSVSASIGEPLKQLRTACRAILAESARIGEDEP
jgi:uncharacterized protein with HEPN domain